MYCPLTLYGMNATGLVWPCSSVVDPTLFRDNRVKNVLHIWKTTQPGWLNNHVVDDAARDQKVGGEDKGEDGPGGGSLIRGAVTFFS